MLKNNKYNKVNKGRIVNEWNEVRANVRREKEVGKKENGCTIFMYKIPDDTTSRDLLDLFKSCGNVKDVILPRKRDKRNNRIGFIKVKNELEAGELINNIKQSKGLGRRLSLSINQESNKEVSKTDLPNQRVSTPVNKGHPHRKENKVKEVSVVLQDLQKDLDKKDYNSRFEYIEAETDPNIEEVFEKSLVGISEEEQCPNELLDWLISENIKNVKVLMVNKKKFLFALDQYEGEVDLLKNILKARFFKIRDFVMEDYIMPRIAVVECVGLPMNAWIEDNLKGFSKSLGEWISWRFQNNEKRLVHNPLVEIHTIQYELIKEEMCVLVNGVKYKVSFREILVEENYKAESSKNVSGKRDASKKDYVRNSTFSSKFAPSTKKVDSTRATSLDDSLEDRSNQNTLVGKSRISSSNDNSLSDTVVPKTLFMTNVHAAERDSINDKGYDLLRGIDSRVQCSMSNSSLDNITNKEDGVSDEDDTVVNPPFVISHNTICNNLKQMKMGGKRGRPRVKPRSFNNPFDFRLGKKRGKGSFKHKGPLRQVTKPSNGCLVMPRIDSKREAAEILDTALALGLEIPEGRVNIEKALAKAIEGNAG